MDGWMDFVCMDGWMDGWMDGRVDGWMMGGWMDGWMNRWMDRWIDGSMWIDRHSLMNGCKLNHVE